MIAWSQTEIWDCSRRGIEAIVEQKVTNQVYDRPYRVVVLGFVMSSPLQHADGISMRDPFRLVVSHRRDDHTQPSIFRVTIPCESVMMKRPNLGPSSYMQSMHYTPKKGSRKHPCRTSGISLLLHGPLEVNKYLSEVMLSNTDKIEGPVFKA